MNTSIVPHGSSLRAWIAVLSLAALGSACGDDEASPADAGTDAAESDAEVSNDAALPDAGGSPFGPCTSDADCPDGTFCDQQISGSVAVSGAPMGMVDQSLFPGGSCSPRPLAQFDSAAACDSSVPQPSQGCGPDGTCVLESLNDATYAACRPACEPSDDGSGCAREGYTCDFGLRACVEGCRSDAECRITVQDNNGDGVSDTLAYDTASSAYCDEATARCTHDGSASVPVGSSCERLDDCAPDSACLEGASALAGLDFPGGYCTTVGCDIEGRECAGEGTVCEPLRGLLRGGTRVSLCMASCEVGAEPPEQRLGPGGHGVGCREGYRCHYNGGAGEASGVCVGGVYNDVTENNVGAACTSHGDCYSPFGYGRCIQYTATADQITAPRGTCTILDCAAPGLPDDICGSGNECLQFAGDMTFCIQNCASAAQCAAGYACTDDDDDPSSPKVCFPACQVNSDCRGAERCQLGQGATYGRCVAS